MSAGPPPSEPRRLELRGIHHVTLICSSLDRSTAFYRDVLGLRLVKEEASIDDPSARHFWFGDRDGTPGTLVSCLEYPRMDEGVVGRGSTHHLAFEVATSEELHGWRSWLESRGIGCSELLDRKWFSSIYLRDPDGHVIEIASRGPGLGGAAGA